MSILLGTNGDSILTSRGAVDLIAMMKSRLAEKGSYLLQEEHLALLREMQDGVAAELALENNTFSQFDAMMKELDRSEFADGLADLHDRFNKLAADYFRERGSVIATHDMCNAYRDSLLRKGLQAAEAAMKLEGFGPPPVPYCWLSSGGVGRREQTLWNDHEYFLVYGAGNEMAEYFDKFSYRIIALLDRIGLLRAGGRVSPMKTFWRGSREEWRQGVAEEFRQTGEKEFTYLLSLADLRLLHGDAALAEDLTGLVREMYDFSKSTQVSLARTITGMPVALGFFGGFRVERSGEHRGEFNLEQYAISPLLMAVRLLVIKHGITATSTIDRIKELLNRRHLGVELSERLLLAYHDFSRQKILLEIRQGEKGVRGLYLNPEEMSEQEAQNFKHGLEAIMSLQRIIYQSVVEPG